MKRKMPIGIEDFQTLIAENYYFVDKTGFIEQFLDEHSAVTLITRPRRFGKTLTLSMLDWFFSIEKAEQSKKLFQTLEIAHADKNYMEECGKYPVVFISLKNIRSNTWETMLGNFRTWISNWYSDYEYLCASDKVQNSLKERFRALLYQQAPQNEMEVALSLLTSMMHQYYGKKVILLLDEYDAPIQRAWENNFYSDGISFMRQFLSSALKTNPDLEFAVLTGVLRIAKESIFSGLNNIDVCSVADPIYDDVMGFTPSEVEQMAKDMQMESYLPELKHWYDGYHFGKAEIYNPWSVINFFRRKEVGDYWVNTSGNSIIQHMLQHLDAEKEDVLLSLLHGESVTAAIREGVIYDDIDRDEDALYTLLLTTGYLTVISRRRGISGFTCELAIPNREVQDVFRVEILDRFKAGLSISRLETMLDDLLNGRTEAFAKRLTTYIRYLVSSYDAANKESFYHGFLLGMTALFVPDYVVESNRESGYGRFDLAIYPKQKHKAGVIMEFKTADAEAQLETKAKEALAQIENRQYMTEFAKREIQTVWKYGIAFCGKKICVLRNEA